MKDFVEKLRQKPHHQQNRIILITVVVVATLLVGIWAVIGIPTRNTPNENIVEKFNSSYQENQNTMPDLFPEQNN